MKKLKNVLLLVLPLVLSSCGDSASKEENTNDIKENVDVVDENSTENNIDDTNEEISISYETKEAGIVNNAVADYRIESEYLTIYTVETSKLPHVDIIDFLSDLDGFFDFKNVRSSYDKEKEELSLYYRNTYNIVFDIKNDVIKADSCFTFLQYCYEAASTDYSEHILEDTDYYVKKSTFSMDLKEYGFDIIYTDSKCLVPLFLANLLFCSFAYYNVLYNNDLVFLEYGEPSEIFGYDDCDDKGKSQDLEYRKEVVNSLYLIFDYYYGLNGYKKFDNGIKEEIAKLNNGKILENLLSSDGYRNLLAYIDIIYTFLDELHSRLDVPSFYWNKANEVSINRGSFGKSYYDIGSYLSTLRNTAGYGDTLVRYKNDLAIITLDRFLFGTLEQTKNKDGSIKDNAYLYDNYYFMRKMMSEIQNHPEVTKVMIDLSLNGGGELAALQRTLGFITDEKISIPISNSLDKSYEIDSCLIDVDGDGNYNNDAYDEYDWYLLTGINTFSAANLMASVFKQMNLGKIIGQKSGGGMCAVLPTVLADGTALTISSPYCLQTYSKNDDGEYVFSDIEGGIDVDATLDYKYFYKDEKIYNIIQSFSDIN